MEDGRIAECGTYKELMEKKGKFCELKKLSDFNAEQPEKRAPTGGECPR